MSFVKGFNMFGTDAIQISCITGNGSPTTSTVGAVGMLYMDTSSSDGDLWKCIEVNDNVYKWVRLINEDLLNTQDSAVLYTNQELTEEQKSQARENIGLSDTDIQGKVQSYVDEAILGGSW